MGVLFEELERWGTRGRALHRPTHHSPLGAVVRRGAGRNDVAWEIGPRARYCEERMTNPVLAAFGRPFRLGIIGGAPPSMIGPVHRVAATMDQRFAIVAGMLSSRPERSRAEGIAIGLPETRCY